MLRSEKRGEPDINEHKNIYLDHAATTKLSETTKQYLISLLDIYGNPSSVHSVGEAAGHILSNARHSVAEFIHANPDDIYFTPSGSASNTLAIRGYSAKNNCFIYSSPIAHKSIQECVKTCKNASPLKVDANGFLDISHLKECLHTQDTKTLVVTDYANSETGTIQNIEQIVDLVHFYHGTVYLDCTGSIPSIPVDIKNLHADMIGFSGHKLGGLKGCGVLYKNPSITLEPLIYGSQENRLVGGTENLLGIASLGKAVENYDYSASDCSSVASANRDTVYRYIIQHIPDSYLIGPSIESGNRLTNNLYMCFRGISGESLLILLDLNGIQVSAGSACNHNDLAPSPVLSAIGMNQNDIHSCIRFSFSGTETPEEIYYVCEKLRECVKRLRHMPPACS